MTQKNPVVAAQQRLMTEVEAVWKKRSLKTVAIGAACFVLAGLAVGAWWLHHIHPASAGPLEAMNVHLPVLHATLPDLQKRVAENPKDVQARVALGRAEFESGAHGKAVSDYQKALWLDPKSGTDEMVQDLVASFGTKEQPEASNLVAEYKLVQATEGLEKLTFDKRYAVRLAALNTLERLGRATHADHLHVLVKDLENPDCDVRRHAVASLGDLGDQRAVQPITVAKQKDDEATPWYKMRCIGGRADDAEKKILAAQKRAPEQHTVARR